MFRRHFLEEEASGNTAGGGNGGNAGSTGNTNASITAPATGAVAGNSGAGAGAGQGVGTTSTPPANGSAWMDALPLEIKSDPSIQLFKESGVNGLAKSWVSAQAMLGKDRVIIPGDKATDEEWAAFHNKLGRPESADKYEFKLPEGQKLDEGFSKGFKDVAFKAGMNAKQVQGLVEWYAKEAGAAVQGQQAATQAELKTSLDAYRDSLGGQDKFMAQVDRARVAVRALGDQKLNEWLDKSGAGSRPEMIDFFARLSGMMSEDKLRDGTGVPFGDDPANIQKEITEVESKMYANLESTHRPEWVQQLSKLYERLEASRQPRQ